MKNIRAGIIGFGGVANSHLGGYQKHEIEVAAVTDVNPDAAKSLAEKAGTIIVKSKEGVLGSMTSAFVAGTGKAFIDIMGQKGEIFYDYCDPDKVKIKFTNKQEWDVEPVNPSNGFAEQIAHFLGAINGKHSLSCTSFDGMRAVEIIQSTYN